MDLCGIDGSKQFAEIIKLIIGLNCKISTIFDSAELEEIENNKISFASAKYDETRLTLEDEIQKKQEC